MKITIKNQKEARIALWARLKSKVGEPLSENEKNYAQAGFILPEYKKGGPLDTFIENCKIVAEADDHKAAMAAAKKFKDVKDALEKEWWRLAKGRLYLVFGDKPEVWPVDGYCFWVHPWEYPGAIRFIILSRMMRGEFDMPGGYVSKTANGKSVTWKCGGTSIIARYVGEKIASYQIRCGSDSLSVFPNSGGEKTRMVKVDDKRHRRSYAILVGKDKEINIEGE